MYENIAGLSIKGRCFDEEKKMVFFPKETDRIAIVYGKNGSGKSTITEGFRQVTNKSDDNDLIVELINQDKNSQVITDEVKENIHIFDEEYIDKNIRISEAGLDTIILFGDQVDVEGEIKSIKKKIEVVKNDVEKLTEEKEKYVDSKNILSPDFYIEKLKKLLKETGGWAEREAQIKNTKHNSHVSSKIIMEIGELKVIESTFELEKKYKETKELLEKVSDNNITFPNAILKKKEIESEEREIVSLLAKKIEKPILTEREKMILSAIENGFQNRVKEAEIIFMDDKIKTCPYCYQPLSIDYKMQMMNSIKKVLNKEVEEHIRKLEDLYLKEYVFDKTEYEKLDVNLVEKIEKKIQACNELVQEYNNHLKEKIDNVFSTISISTLGLNNCVRELNDLLEQLERKRLEFNDISKKGEKIKEELIDINKRIAHNNIATDYNTYKKQEKEKEKIITNLNKKNEELNNNRQKLKKLEDRKKNVAIAIDQINKSLEYVFFSKNRLVIELKNDLYYLKSNGNYVKPCDVSCGERNIIALCYFFTQIMSNLELKQIYAVEKYIVIDDPVSSFDFENKIGIISFLKKQFSDIIMGNNNSKILVFSHDLTTIFDLQKAATDIRNATRKISNINNITFSWLEIKNKSLDQFVNNRSEYTELLKLVYAYAKDKSGVDSISIGNTMRRVLEAFSTFSYKKGIQDITCDPEIMKDVPHKDYFENLMYRLVLHNESHYEEQIKNFHDGFNFYDFISEDEKQKTAREVLCLICILNPLHIKTHLQEDAYNEIMNWTKNLS